MLLWDIDAFQNELALARIVEQNPGASAAEINAAYNFPYIFCCVGTMNNNYLPSVTRVVEAANAKGLNKVHLVDLGLIIPEVEGCGGMFHPGLQAHYRMGVDLANEISRVTGWPLRQRPTKSLL